MITSRGTRCAAAAGTIKPPFAGRASAVMACSISPASRTLIRAHLHPERWGQGLHRAELARPGRYGRSLQERHALHARRNLLEQLQPFGADAAFKHHETRSLAPRPGEGFH